MLSGSAVGHARESRSDGRRVGWYSVSSWAESGGFQEAGGGVVSLVSGQWRQVGSREAVLHSRLPMPGESNGV